MIPRIRRPRVSDHELNGALDASYRHADFAISTRAPEDPAIELTHIVARAERLRDIQSPAQLRRAGRPLVGARPRREVLIMLLAGLSGGAITWAIHDHRSYLVAILSALIWAPAERLFLFLELSRRRLSRKAPGTLTETLCWGLISSLTPWARQERHKRDHDGGPAATPAD
jgi:hypothetical protein